MSSPIQLVTQALQQRDFKYVHSATGYVYEGRVSIGGKQISMRVSLADETFVDLPVIQLLEWPDGMPNIVPHLSPDGNICYAARGTVALNIFDPAGQTLACLDRAIQVAERAINGELEDDLVEEFFAYWSGDPAFADLPLSKIGSAKAFLCRHTETERTFLVLTDNAERTREKLTASMFDAGTEAVDVQVFTAKRSPGVRRSSWPPSTVGEFLSWQGELDTESARRIKQSLQKLMRDGRKYAVTLIQSPTSWYGILTKFNLVPQEGALSARLNILPTLLRSQIWPLSITRIDDEYLASRNIPNRTSLTGIRIALIGCGTIGAYLADLMIRAGAGLGGGELELIDPEFFVPGNLGRHRLGLPAMYRRKAEALAEDLRRIVPSVHVTARPVDARKVMDLEKFDLVVDATGEEALSNHLNLKFHGERFVPMVFTWIAEGGKTVHVLIRDTKDAACYQCLTRNVGEGHAGAASAVLAGYGCESLYVPFPVSVSVSAAALALDAILDWANHQSSPKYRKRSMTGPFHSYQDSDCQKAPNCPACTL